MPVRVETNAPITKVTLDRPRLNLLDGAVIAELTRVFREIDPNAPIILTGAGDVFSAGVDVKAFGSLDRAGRGDFARAITAMTAAILAIRAPLVAALPGHAIGGGLVLALCCDFRIAADNPSAKFGLTEARAGVPFPSGPAEIIRHEIPAPLLRRMTLASEEMNARQLSEAGLFDGLTAPSELIAQAEETALNLAAQPGFVAVKDQIRGSLRDRVAQLRES
jgi:enoyl-CoA hydratase